MRVSDPSVIRPLHPEGGFLAALVDVVDLGLEQTGYGLKPKVRLVFETEHMVQVDVPDGRGGMVTVERPAIISRKFTASLHDQAPLRAFLTSWRGRAFSAQELRDFDLDALIGAPAYLTIVHQSARDGSGKTYDNIEGAAKLPRGTPPLVPSGAYVRVKDRPPQPNQPGQPNYPQRAPQAPQPPRPQAPRPQAPRPQPVQAYQQPRHAPPPPAAPEDFEDFPAALEDEDDDLPF